MQSIEKWGLDQLTKELDDLLKAVPEARRELHEDMAALLKEEVEAQIDISGINDSSGKIKDWQQERVGSGGGYAAIRAVSGKIGNNSPGAITNYLESGHKIATPSGRAERYRPRINKPYVSGYHFYQAAAARIEARAIRLAERFADELAKRIGG